ncbi:TonB-dependent receptor [Sphingobium sp. Sx8-8]|uniref:TonB-dependent receptor n=1 Tax=Sphingobium sp. Sx8-8 TaxID=2933617 RepID=UPI001F59AD50|nr:TonB-dependent receptor [Sphingobium sp. Sx8-8]
MPAAVLAQGRDAREFDLPAQDLGDALRMIAAEAGWELYASAEDVNGVSVPRLQGRLTARQAIERLLAGTNLRARFTKGAVIIRGREQAEVDASPSSDRSEIVVTGSRIRGAPPSAPIVRITAEDIRRAGQSDLGDVIRSSPLNFGGGQNPGIGTSQGSANENVNGASSVNLYGLGPNATLTLLNGNRLSYTGVNAAVDISAIPAVAVERVEIVADGASAIYGADAVAGVVNVVSRRDYEGMTVASRFGGATDGGYFQQQYNVAAGHTWTGGGLLAVYDYTSNSAIMAGSRSYTANMAADSSIYPKLSRHSVLVSLFQDIGSSLSAKVDLLYKDGRQNFIQSFTDRPYRTGGGTGQADITSFIVAPSLTARLGRDWTARLISSFGRDKTRINSDIWIGGAVYGTSERLYDNDSVSLEVGAEGPLVSLPAGSARLAIGAGYRRTGISLLSSTLGIVSRDFDQHQENRFGYAEAFFPVIAPAQASPLGRSLSITAAFRYEANPGVGSVALPKLGVAYEPIEGLTLKGSWGRSFRLPTLFQRHSGYSAVLALTQRYATGFPPGSTMIVLVGASPDMKPERSTNWTVSADFEPDALPGLNGTLSYFHFAYKDRIATPVETAVGVLNDPAYADLITLSPSLSLQQALAGGADIGLQNSTGRPYDPSSVVAIVDRRDRNVARATYKGMGLSLRYAIGNPDREKIDFSFDGTWIESSQRLFPGLPSRDLAGTLFNPPHLRGRFGVSYSVPLFTMSGFANLSSDLTDNRTNSSYKIHGPSTFDLSAVVRADKAFEIGFTINNIFNAKPPVIMSGSPSDTPFDSTNFSQIGRFIAVSLRKSW